MITKISLINRIDDEEEKKKNVLGSQFGGGWGISNFIKKPKEEETEEEKPPKIAKIAPITTPVDTQLGAGAKAVGETTLAKPEQTTTESDKFTSPMDKINYYKSKIDWLESIFKEKGKFEWGGTFDAYRYAVEQYNKAIEEYNIQAETKYKHAFKKYKQLTGLPGRAGYETPLIPGYKKVEDTKISAYQEPEKNILEKLKEKALGIFKEKPETQIAKAQVSYNISQKTGIPLPQIEENLDKYSKALGIRGIPTGEEYMTAMFAFPITAAIISNPISAGIGISKFLALSEAENLIISKSKGWEYQFGAGKGLKELTPEGTNQITKDILNIVDFVAKGIIIGATDKSTKALWNKFTKDVVTKYSPSQRIYLSSEKIKDLHLTNPKLATQFEKDVYTNLEGKAEAVRTAFKKGGIDIEIPVQTITKIADKPYWAKIKGLFNIKPFSKTIISNIKGKWTEHPAGLLPSPATELGAGVTPKQIANSIVSAGKVTADMVKGLDPIKVSQITQQLLNINPALANEFLKAVEKPEAIPEVEPKEPKEISMRDDYKLIDKWIQKELPKQKAFDRSHKLKMVSKQIREGNVPDNIAEAMRRQFEPTLDMETGETLWWDNEDYPRTGTLMDFYNAYENLDIIEKPIPKVVEPKIKPEAKPKVIESKVEIKPEPTKADLATPAQIKKAHAIANSKAMISPKGKMKPQYRKIAEVFTGVKSIKDMTPEQAETFIDMLGRLPEPKYKKGKLVAPSIPRTMKLTTEGFFRKKYGEPTPVWLLTDQTYYATKLGIKPLVEPFEKGKQEFDLEFRKSSNLVDRMVNKLNTIAKTPGWERIKSKVKNIPTKAESNMAELLNNYETTPPGLTEKEEDVFKYFRNLSKDIWRRENEVREKIDLPPIKYKTAYFRHTADAMAKEMLEGKYPFPEGIKYWGEKMVGKKIFNPMEFQRKLSDDLIDLWSKDIRAVTKAMLWNGLKEIYLAQPAKFLNEQLGAISKDLPEYKNLTPREQKAYDQTQVMPASTKKWLVDYVNQVIKGQETEIDASKGYI